MRFVFVLVLLSLPFYLKAKEEYQLVYIDNLTEQQIGKLIIQEVYKRLDIPVFISPEPAIRSERSTKQGVVDGEVMRIYAYGDENPNVVRVPTPYYMVETMPFVRSESGIEINKPEDLNKYTVARIRGIKHTRNVSQQVKEVVELNDSHQLVKFIHLKRADVALTSTVEGVMSINSNQLFDVVPMKKPLAKLELYHYLHKKHQQLVPIVDAKIKSLRDSGELDKIIKKAELTVLGGNL